MGAYEKPCLLHEIARVAELTGHISDAAAKNRNYDAMLHRTKTCLREGGCHFEQLQ
jgi:hypothetical protein